MSFVISALSADAFRPLFDLADEELAARGVLRRTANAKPGFPCRLTLEDAEPGESVLLLNYEHQPAETPFRAAHAIYVRERAAPPQTVRYVDEVAPVMAARSHMSLRAFDESGMMVDAELAPRAELKPTIERLLGQPNVAYLHAHYAGAGCYAARIDRA